MAAGLAGLAALAAVAGLAQPWFGEVLPVEIPETAGAIVLGLATAVVGLLAGWYRPAAFWLGPVRPAAETGFRVDGGFVGLAVRPALAVARLTDRLDRGIHASVLEIGTGGRRVASWVDGLDAAVHRVVEGVGALGLMLANLAQVTDNAGIDVLIARLVQGTRQLGGRARRLQTGLVHRELLIAAGGAVAAVLVVLLS
jgi:NADH-quinone oxidoreductase subunit L